MQPCPDQALGAPSRVTLAYKRTIASEHRLDRLCTGVTASGFLERFLRCETSSRSAPCRWRLLDAFVFATVRPAPASVQKQKGFEMYPHGEETRALRKLTNFPCKQSDASLRVVPGLVSFANAGQRLDNKQLNLKADGDW